MAIVIVGAFLLLMFLPSSLFNKSHTRRDQVINTSVKVPEFRHDGELYFITANGQDTVAIHIEVVDEHAEITRGLMYRPYLPESAGMLFIFPDEEPRSFWMKNTYISLDIIFIDSNREIVTIQPDTQPLSSRSIPSDKPAKYVLEVNAGFTAKYNIQEGDRVEF